MTYPTTLQLHKDSHPILRQVAEPVTVFDEDLITFIAKMQDAMIEWNGCGLAAPQVGVSKRIIVAQWPKGHPINRRYYINPVLERPKGAHTAEEGCLSIPGVYARVQRPRSFTLTYQGIYASNMIRGFNSSINFLGAIIQHEVDHLDGILFTDKVAKP